MIRSFRRWFKGWLSLAALAFGLAGCPRLPAPDGCTPGESFCRDGVPVVCSQTQRATPADQSCAAIGGVCCATVAPSGRTVAACVPAGLCLPVAPDAAADAADGAADGE